MKNEKNTITEELKQNVEESGPDLKKIRESKGITLEELFELTRISNSILMAIESEEYHLLPEYFYARTFIKTYAQAVGVDSEKILSRYEEYLRQRKSFRKGTAKSKNCLSEFYASHRSLSGWILTALFVIVFVIFLLYPKQKTQKYETEVADKSKTQAVVEKAKPLPAVVEKTKPLPAVVENKAEELKTKIKDKSVVNQDIAKKETEIAEATYKVTIEATELVWLNITVDNKPPEEVLLRPGEKIYEEASKGFIIDIGNAGGVNLTFQGESLGSLGKHGQVIHLTLPGGIENKR